MSLRDDERLQHEPTYRLWPRWEPGAPELGGAGIAALLGTGGAMLVISFVLCIPIVSQALGLPPRVSLPLMATYYACMWGNDYVLHPWAMRSKRGLDAQLVVVPLYNVAFLAAFILVPNEPRSPLWLGFLLYTGTTAAWQEIDKSWAFLAFHVLAPLATIPIFLHRGAPLGWSVAGPLLTAVVCGAGYHLIAMTTTHWKRIRAEQARTIEALRRDAAEAERRTLARDLHDSVGSTLGLLALYGDLLERHAREPEQLVRLASTLREATREGLGELRGVLDAMAPIRGDLTTLAENLERTGARAAEASGASVQIALEGPGHVSVDGPVRLALVRIFQESVANALRHGKARRITAHLSATEGERVRLTIDDDGSGFDDARARPGARGVEGMRERAEELGGRCVIEGNAGTGATVVLDLPRSVKSG